MSGWAKKRFWTQASVAPQDVGFAVLLDGRTVCTPLKTALVLPTQAFARAVADEWAAQTDEIDPLSMPFTRAANAALDKVAPQRAELCDMLASYGGTDLLCYRATGPEGLIQRQAQGWDAHLDWAARRYEAPLQVTHGVLPVEQPQDSLARLRAALDPLSVFELTGLHDLVTISGSLVLALAVSEGILSAEDAFDLSRIDEHWQIDQWGKDEEAAETEAAKRTDFLRAKVVMDLSRDGDAAAPEG